MFFCFKQLLNGSKTYKSGKLFKLKGKWGYIPELQSVELLDGLVIYRNGLRCEGKRRYYPQKKRMDLEDGLSLWTRLKGAFFFA